MMEYEVDSTPATLESFLYARHYGDEAVESSLERRLEKISEFESKYALKLPPLLRALYEQQDGGHTEFQYVPIVDNPQYLFKGSTAEIDFGNAWRTAFPDNDLYPLRYIRTIGEASDQILFGEESWSWRNRVPEADSLLIINSHGDEFFLCLDYSEGRQIPKVAFLAANDEDDAFDVELEYDSFGDFFQATRRLLSRHGDR